MIYDVAIIGAGASGLMIASKLNNTDKKVTLIESNSKIGQKIKISGGGKCNITNKYMSSDHFLGNKQFIESVLSRFDQNDLLKYLNNHNIYPKVIEKIVKGTYFCNSGTEVVEMFRKNIKNIDLKLNTKVKDVKFDNIFTIETNTTQIKAKKLIVASGGLAYPAIGASSIGFDIAKSFGHTISRVDPALVGFTVQKDQFWFKSLSGLSLDVQIKVENKIIEGSMLFTHKGCSGPAILTTSLYWKKGQISINFLPKKDSYLPKRFKKAIKDLNIDLKDYKISPAGNFGFTKAEVSKGGVATDEVDLNMESKLQKGLYFIGEVLDVTGELGGYNLQWGFSSGNTVNI